MGLLQDASTPVTVSNVATLTEESVNTKSTSWQPLVILPAITGAINLLSKGVGMAYTSIQDLYASQLAQNKNKGKWRDPSPVDSEEFNQYFREAPNDSSTAANQPTFGPDILFDADGQLPSSSAGGKLATGSNIKLEDYPLPDRKMISKFSDRNFEPNTPLPGGAKFDIIDPEHLKEVLKDLPYHPGVPESPDYKNKAIIGLTNMPGNFRETMSKFYDLEGSRTMEGTGYYSPDSDGSDAYIFMVHDTPDSSVAETGIDFTASPTKLDFYRHGRTNTISQLPDLNDRDAWNDLAKAHGLPRVQEGEEPPVLNEIMERSPTLSEKEILDQVLPNNP